MGRIQQIQLRRGTAAAWATANPVLAAGEPGLETDTGVFKLGDGATAWNSLGFAPRDRDAPAYAPANLKHKWDASRSAYNISGATMHSRRSKQNAAAYNIASLHQGWAGNSLCVGYDGATYNYTKSVPARCGQHMARLLGHPYPTLGWHLAVGAFNVLGDRWVTNTGSWTKQNMLYNTTTNATATYTTPHQCAGFKIAYSGPSFTYKVDGEGTSRTAPATAANQVLILDVTTLQSGTALTNKVHSIVVTCPTVLTIFLAQRCYNPGLNQIHTHNFGLGGAKANGGTGENWSVTTMNPLGLGGLVPAILTADGLDLDDIAIMIGGNDLFNSESVATTKTGIENMLGYWSDINEFLVHEFYIDGTDTTAAANLGTEFFNMADEHNIPMLDWADFINGTPSMLADTQAGADGVHPKLQHQNMVAAWIAEQIVGRPMPVADVWPGLYGLGGGRWKVVEQSGVYPVRPNVPAGFVDYAGPDDPVDSLPGDTVLNV